MRSKKYDYLLTRFDQAEIICLLIHLEGTNYFISLLTTFLLLTYFFASRHTPPMFFSLKNGRTIDSNCPRIWPASTACYRSSGSASFGDPIVFSKTPRKSRSKLWQYPIITFGSTKIAPFSTWSSEFSKFAKRGRKTNLENTFFLGLPCSSVVLCTLKITHMTSKYADFPWRAVSYTTTTTPLRELRRKKRNDLSKLGFLNLVTRVKRSDRGPKGRGSEINFFGG